MAVFNGALGGVTGTLVAFDGALEDPDGPMVALVPLALPPGALANGQRRSGRHIVACVMERLPNIPPGEILLEEFLNPLGISQGRLAREIKVPLRQMNEIVLGKRAITADTALRLARYFATSERFWLGLEMDYELEKREPLRGSLHRRSD
jgi:addiction module HigA family antidote